MCIRDRSRFLVFDVKGSKADITLKNNGTMLVEAAMGSLNVANPSASNERWRRVAHTDDDSDRTVEVSYRTFLPNVVDYPGYDTYFKLKMSSLSAISATWWWTSSSSTLPKWTR